MKNQDPSLEHLNAICEEIIYDTYCQAQPDLVKHIEFLIRKGHTPTDIENFVRQTAPAASQVSDHVYIIAIYLLRMKLSAN